MYVASSSLCKSETLCYHLVYPPGMNICVCVYVCTYVCVYMYVCMYVCVYVCVYVCIYVCVCMYVRMYNSNADDDDNDDCTIIQPAAVHVVFFLSFAVCTK